MKSNYIYETAPNHFSPHQDFEIKHSKTEDPIPVIDGIHLHSVYNPKKEAEALVARHLDSIKENKNVLIFGLGFGYHLEKLIETFEEYDINDYRICVIDPNYELFKSYEGSDQYIVNKHVQYYIGSNVSDLYNDINFVDFLIKKPVVIAHPASFNLYGSYFKYLLSFEAESSVAKASELVSLNTFSEYLFNRTRNCPHIEIDDFIEQVGSSKQLTDEYDFLMLAFGSLTGKDVGQENINE